MFYQSVNNTKDFAVLGLLFVLTGVALGDLSELAADRTA